MDKLLGYGLGGVLMAVTINTFERDIVSGIYVAICSVCLTIAAIHFVVHKEK